MSRILAVDPGKRRVGVALTDPLGMIASPYETLRNAGETGLAREIRRIVSEKDVELVLVGHPMRPDGYEGEGCRRSRRLLEQLTRLGVRAILWDESDTTKRALEVTREHGMSARRSRVVRDRVAASLILQGYLAERGRHDP